MIIHNPKLKWIKGEHGYKQGIKGSKNRRHMEGQSYYNGYGGARMNVDMELNLIAEDEHGKQVVFDVRHYLVEALGKKVMRDDLFHALCSCLPNELEIDDSTHKLSDNSLHKIKEAYDMFMGSV